MKKQDEILLEVASMGIKPLPEHFAGVELNYRIWKAFDYGRKWEEEKGREERRAEHD